MSSAELVVEFVVGAVGFAIGFAVGFAMDARCRARCRVRGRQLPIGVNANFATLAWPASPKPRGTLTAHGVVPSHQIAPARVLKTSWFLYLYPRLYGSQSPSQQS